MSEEDNKEILAEEQESTEETAEDSASAGEVVEEERKDPAFQASEDSPELKWYITKTLTGQENKVAKSLRERIVNLQKSEYFADILVPEETVVSNAGGKKRTIKKKYFPGYVLVRMVLNNDTWHLVKDTDKITGFIGGTPDRPQPITDDEAAYMLGQVAGEVSRPKSTASFTEGEQVKVIEGPFASFVGTVEEVSDKGKVKVNVSIFGRPTPVELDFAQVEKVS